MTKDDIIILAQRLKKQYNTNSPHKLCTLLSIPLSYFQARKDVRQGYYLCGVININSNFDYSSQEIIAAHELGHALLHTHEVGNYFNETPAFKESKEYEANLFAVALLFEEDQLACSLSSLSNDLLKYLLETNINYN